MKVLKEKKMNSILNKLLESSGYETNKENIEFSPLENVLKSKLYKYKHIFILFSISNFCGKIV